MGIMSAPPYCHITGLETINFDSSHDSIEYFITINNRKILFRFDSDYQNNNYVEQNKHILHGLILNGKFPAEYNHPDGQVLDNNKIRKNHK